MDGEARRAFERAYGDRYELTRRLSACAFEGTERATQTRIRLKFVTAAPPAFSHELVAARLAVLPLAEPAESVHENCPLVVVSSYAPGATLGQVLRSLKQQPPVHATLYRDALFFGFAPLLCRAVEALHGAGIAHGQLHGDNVIVRWQDDRFVPTLIDLGPEASPHGDVDALELESARADRTRVAQHVVDMARGSFWSDEVAELVRSAPDLACLRAAIESARAVLGALDNGDAASFTAASFREDGRVARLRREVWRDHHERFMRRVARRMSVEALLEAAAAERHRRLYDPESVRSLDGVSGHTPTPPGFSYEAIVRPRNYPAAPQV